ncbi:MAG: tetratricopeptide repeat protein [Sneathiellales bacterium]|nr:tetratricopeptide repeat protein [Sneathiellales bacterium]
MKHSYARNLTVAALSFGALLGLSACAGGANTGTERVPDLFLDEGGTAAPYQTSFAGQYLAGRQAFRDKNPEIAADYFDQVLNYNPADGFILQNTFQVALAKGDMERALVLAKEISAQNKKDNGAAQLILSIDALRNKDFGAAAEYLRRTQTTGFNILLKPVLNSWILLGEGKKEEAFKSLDDLDRYDGFKALKSYHQALLSDVAGDTEKAQAYYKDASSGPAGRAIRFIHSYASFLVKQGETARAKLILDEYHKRFPLSPSANRLKSEFESTGSVRPLIETPSDGAAEALYSSATIVGQERVRGVANTYAHFALMVKPELIEAKALLAEIAEDENKWEKALSHYAEIPETSPYSRNAQIRSAWIIYKLGETDKAISRLEDLARQDPDDIEALVVLADLNRDQKNWRNAAQAYGRAIDNIGEAKSRLWSLHYARGIAYERLNEWPLAEKDLKQALKLRPDHPQILNYLGYSWVDRGENLEDAKGMLIKAVSLRPRDGYIVDSLGWLYYRLNDFENATKQLEKAVALQPEDPTINDHLGDAYWRVGRYEEARYQWQRALWLDPEEKQIPLIEEKLRNGLPALGQDGK